MTFGDVPVLPFRAGRHLAAWIVWHTARVSWLEDAIEEQMQAPVAASKGRRRTAKG